MRHRDPSYIRMKKRTKIVGWSLVTGISLLVIGELCARFILGLGDPPLSIEDSEIEYIFAPNQDCKRFGNRIVYNNYSLRNDYDITTNEVFDGIRILMIGDSVLNGGAQTDHSKLATTLAEKEIKKITGKNVQVLNLSAGSWGPANYAAYIKKYGDFDADVIGFVLSSHDVWDVPTFEKIVGIHKGFPNQKPVSALAEGFNRYLIPRIVKKSSTAQPIKTHPDDKLELDAQESLDALASMIKPVQQRGANVFFILHRTQQEWKSDKTPEGEAIFHDFGHRHGIECFILDLDSGQNYRDGIHINENGQIKLSTLIQHSLN